MSQTVKAIYPGTFDPLTLGHENIIVRSAQMFDRVILAVAHAHHKKTLLTLPQRIELAQIALKDHPNIEVIGFEGLVKDFALEQGAKVMIRGVRSMTDFDYESQLAGMNRLLAPELETIFLTPEPQFQSLSSTLIREIASLGGEVSQWVSAPIDLALKEKFKA
jgi:pantetheine-phosphate adenylyltransferase